MGGRNMLDPDKRPEYLKNPLPKNKYHDDIGSPVPMNPNIAPVTKTPRTDKNRRHLK